MPDTVSANEVLWVVICLWGTWRHGSMYRDIDCDVRQLEAGVIAASDGAMALFLNDRDTAADWTLFHLSLAMVGMVGWFRPNLPLDWRGWLVVALLYCGVLFGLVRSEARGRRRARIKAGIHE